MDRQEMLQREIERISKPVYMSSKEEIVRYYQKEYPGTGKSGWKQTLIRDTLAAKGVTKAGVGDKEYARQSKNMARRFDPSRLNTPEKKTSKEYQALGKTLPPIARKPTRTSITVQVEGQQKMGKRTGTRDRTIDAKISGADLYHFVNNPQYSDIWDAYGVDDGLFDDGDYELTVTGVSIY